MKKSKRGKGKKWKEINLFNKIIFWTYEVADHILAHGIQIGEIYEALQGSDPYIDKFDNNDYAFVVQNPFSGLYITVLVRRMYYWEKKLKGDRRYKGYKLYRLKTARQSSSVEKRIYKRKNK